MLYLHHLISLPLFCDVWRVVYTLGDIFYLCEFRQRLINASLIANIEIASNCTEVGAYTHLDNRAILPAIKQLTKHERIQFI